MSPHPRPITTRPELEALCGRLSSATHLAIDTEFIRDRTYYAQLCLVQIASEHEHALVDPLVLRDLGPLRELLMAPGIVKVFHAGRQDIEIFHALWGEIPAPIFDTQLAATLLGHASQASYARLVADVLGVQLDKAGTLTDWARRPLSTEQLQYAADDVIHLATLYGRMRVLLEEQGRLSWLDAEHAALADPASYLFEPEDTWRQVKGAGSVRGRHRSVLRQLAGWRERQARERNLPRRWIVPDESLVELARRCPRTLDDLRLVRGVRPDLVERCGEDILAIVVQAEIAPEEAPSNRAPEPVRVEPAAEALADLLGCLVRLRALEKGVAPTQLATRAQVERVAAEGEFAEVPVLEGWRREVVGEDLLALREGRLRLVVRDGVVVVEGDGAASE